ncbi:MAG TPA: glycosyltransferase family 4 protein [Stellaceae bacterium]|jgi:glycosyltransferase involved in cell wall biosynthesis|nr:glycosyltransferase family 4 protein [Stellaceae bacterium]
MTRRLKIGVATAGRFHVLDLARELHALGHEVRFYSYVPRARARRFGLADECHVALLPFALPMVAWERWLPRFLPNLRERLLYAVLNGATILRLRRCDVFICMSGIYVEAARYAKRRYGALIWLHRGSQHILAQDEILAAIPGAERPSKLAIRRELAGYEIADRVVIASHHVEDSFIRDPAAFRKLFLNPYGVDLGMFPQRQRERHSLEISFLFVGIWCLRKGCDLLVQSVRGTAEISLTHIGAIGDTDFPTGECRFRHLDPLPQAMLAKHYATTDVFVLASREDGFGVVLSQALAAGLPVICTDRTGGPELAYTPALAARITVVPAGDVEALAAALAMWRDRLRQGYPLPPLTEADREMLSWSAYARRHSAELERSVLLTNPDNRKPAEIHLSC